MGYALPKVDFKKEMEEFSKRMKDAEKNGEFNDIEDEIDSTKREMTIEEAKYIISQQKYINAANYTEEALEKSEFCRDVKRIIQGEKALYMEAIRILNNAEES